MISFDNFNMDDSGPIYMQIILHVKRGIAAGTIQDGDELPSRRLLSTLLGMNPNTVQKAYKMLEEEGLIASHSGAKSAAVLNDAVISAVRSELMEQEALSVIFSMKQMGISKDDALKLIEKYWE